MKQISFRLFRVYCRFWKDDFCCCVNDDNLDEAGKCTAKLCPPWRHMKNIEVAKKAKSKKFTFKDVQKMFPDTPVTEVYKGAGFQMMDRPCHPDAVVRMLKDQVVHLDCYIFLWTNRTS